MGNCLYLLVCSLRPTITASGGHNHAIIICTDYRHCFGVADIRASWPRWRQRRWLEDIRESGEQELQLRRSKGVGVGVAVQERAPVNPLEVGVGVGVAIPERAPVNPLEVEVGVGVARRHPRVR